MGTRIHFSPSYGAKGGYAISYLLQIDDLTVLLDCGWTGDYDVAMLQPLLEALPKVDIILLSHCTVEHLGALPYLLTHHRTHAQIYATVPVYKMGMLVMYDEYHSHRAQGDFEVFGPGDVDQAFRQIRQLKYQQYVRLKGAGEGFTITAFAAGHTLGGAIWRITTPAEEHVVYAPDSNHQREAHLNAGVLEKVAVRPAVLVCGCSSPALGAKGSPPLSRKDREKGLIDTVKRTLRGEGNVLIPIDAVGRLLEIVLLLDGHWAASALTYPLCLLTHVGGSTLEAARSQLEWMSHALSRDFGTKRDNPFACRRVRVLHQAQEALALAGPKVVLATSQSLEAGPARTLFAEWAANPRNLVLFPVQPQEGTLAAEVAAASPGSGVPASLGLALSHRVELQGEELEAWQQAQHDRLVQAEGDSHDEEDDIEGALISRLSHEASLPSRTSTGTIARMARSLLSNASQAISLPGEAGDASLQAVAQATDPAVNPDVLLDGFSVPEGCAAPMFPDEDLSEDELQWDDFGSTLRPDEFLPKARAGSEALQLGDAPAPQSPFNSQGPLTPGDPSQGDEQHQRPGDEEEEGEDPPSKVVTSDMRVQLRARVVVLDFCGLSDPRSLTTILGNVAPRHLILVHGTPQATEALRQAAAAELAGCNATIHVPSVGQCVDASTGSSAFHVVLAESLSTHLRMRPMGDCQVAWLNGVAAPAAEEGQPMELVPGTATMHDEAYIVDERLSEVAGALARAGIAAEWAASALVLCGGRVIVRRGGVGSKDLTVQGALCPDFYRVQSVIRSQYHLC